MVSGQCYFFLQAEDGIRDDLVTGVQTCALPIYEIMRISDEITVMRDGSSICTLARDETDIGALIALMVGRQMQDIYPPRGPAPDRSTRALLQVRGLGLAGRFEGIDFEVHAGEIVGFFGLVGSGRSDVMDALFGMHRCTGSILMHGRPLRL